jgi:hypothetical protein
MTPDEAMAAARAAVKHWHPLPPRIAGVLLAELDSRGVAIERVRELCNEQRVEAQGGGLTDADMLWPSEVLDALDGQS